MTNGLLATASSLSLISASSPSTATPTPNSLTLSSSPAPLYPSSGNNFTQLGASNGSQDNSVHTALIIGIVVGVSVLIMILSFLMWWHKRGRLGSDQLINRDHRVSLSTEVVGHPYQGPDGESQPYVYPSSTNENAGYSRELTSGLILTSAAYTKPRQRDDVLYNNSTTYGSREERSTIQGTEGYTGSSDDRPPPPPSKDGLRLSMPPPAYQPSNSTSSHTHGMSK